ncbi:MAG: transposase [Persicimonas sp.]
MKEPTPDKRDERIAEMEADNKRLRDELADRDTEIAARDAELAELRQAHLLREFHQMAQRDGPVGRIGEQLESLCRNLQREWAKVREGERDRQDFVAWVRKKVRPRWERLLRRADRLGKEAPAVVRWLIDEEHIEVAWTFLDHEGLEPTNNGAERALRGPVIQRKLSWGSQSEEGLRLMERLWTTAETCRLQATSLLDYITEAVASFRDGRPAPILVEC